ncbi:phage holin family protein [Actinacidiphila acididurans]|uniref:Phage holin family protein n=1 Tax=Actinacidiphila acididurans TaxID=2784346 RepID=A0ABS2TQZ5_9ACTN|nr:phage holin family protein [Actinacidiphila acididurans]MBM9505753.1 phage holin family protein [Actinacidiphila acididurans]
MSQDHNGDNRSLGQLFASATADLSALVHDEIALAKAELRQDAKRAALGSGALVAAIGLAIFAVPMLSFACAYGIHALGVTLGWSFLIVFGAYMFLAGVAGLVGYSRFKKVKKPERSITSAKQTAAVLQKAKPHPRPLEPKDARPSVTGSAANPAIEAKM